MSTTPLPSELHAYPGLRPVEQSVLRNWLARNQRNYNRFEYNVRVGPGFDPGPSYPDNIRKMSIANSQKRIDAVAWEGDRATLIEVKERAGLGAAGQLIGYNIFWRREHPNYPPPRLLVIASQVSPGVDEIYAHSGIALELVTL